MGSGVFFLPIDRLAMEKMPHRQKKDSRPLFALLAICLLYGGRAAAEAPNPIFVQLLGVTIDPQGPVRLPPPAMADGLGAEAQRKVLAQLADDNHPLEALLRKSVVAPFVIKISDDKTPGAGLTGTARRVDVWFVVHADFARITSEDFLLNQITPDAKTEDGKSDFHGHPLTASELQARMIVPA